MAKTFPAIFIFILALFLPLQPWAGDDQATLEAIQKRYDSVKTFKAKFVQKAYIKVMDQTQESAGEVYIKKPGKMKWTYRAPDPQVLISNNQTLWLYLPEERQVTKALIEDIYTTNTPALFLSGKGRLADSFDISSVTRDSKKITVVLAPKQKDQDLDRLVLFIDNKNYQIIGSKVYDRLGNRTEILFSNIEINLEFPDRMFDFQVPKGVDLLDMSLKK